jgi:uncharacterized membrane protein YgdD (TMEM256/DUF423 family)
MERIFLMIGAVSAFISVAAGAYGSHGLKGRLTPDMLAVFEIGVRYQMYHALGLIAVSFAQAQWPGRLMTAAGILFVVGTVLFSGTLYLYCLSGTKWFGPLTPIGGGILMAGWLCMAAGALK